jgi:cell division inhibitor SepF
MSVWARTLVYLGLREESDDAVDWQVVEDAAAAPQASGTGAAASSASSSSAPDAPPSNVRPLRTGLDVSSERVTVVQVRVFEDVETIGSRYRRRQPVLFDVSACSREVARRTVDFVSGLTYASRGTLRRTAPRAFLLVPEGLDIPLDERRRLAQLGYDVEGVAR